MGASFRSCYFFKDLFFPSFLFLSSSLLSGVIIKFRFLSWCCFYEREVGWRGKPPGIPSVGRGGRKVCLQIPVGSTLEQASQGGALGVVPSLPSPPPWLCDINTHQSALDLLLGNWSHMKKISTEWYNFFQPAAVPTGLSALKLVNERGGL